MTSEHAVKLLRAIRDHSGLTLADLRAAGRHGADAGWSGFTYYTDTSEFIANNREIVWEALAEHAAEFGHGDNVAAFIGGFNRADDTVTTHGFDCLIAWWAVEVVGQWLTDRRESRGVLA